MQKANIISNYKYQSEIQSMMFTFGEVRTSLPETLQLVEDLLHYQAAEWVCIQNHVLVSALIGIFGIKIINIFY